MDIMKQEYIPALRFNWLTSTYDFLMRYGLRESTFRERLVRQLGLRPRHRVLDLGCGTATLSMLIKRGQPETEVIGLDGDPGILRRARAKIVASGLDIRLEQALAHQMPFADASFDRVVSSLMFHHLTPGNKRRALSEIYRVLRPGGQLHVVDWGLPQNALMRCAFLPVQILDGFATTADSVAGKLPDYMQEEAFGQVRIAGWMSTILGTLTFYQATRPEDAPRPSGLPTRNHYKETHDEVSKL